MVRSSKCKREDGWKNKQGGYFFLKGLNNIRATGTSLGRRAHFNKIGLEIWLIHCICYTRAKMAILDVDKELLKGSVMRIQD